MKKHQLLGKRWGFVFFSLCIFSVSMQAGNTVKLPGTLQQVSGYLHYPLPSAREDLIYHLDEMLLFDEEPTLEDIGMKFSLAHRSVMSARSRNARRLRQVAAIAHRKALNMTSRRKLQKILLQHGKINEFLFRLNGNHSGTVSLDLNTPEGFWAAEKLLKLTGLILKRERNANGKPGYLFFEDYSPPSFELNEYYQVANIRVGELAKKLAETHRFEFKVSECDIELPGEIDFFREVTGLDLSPDNFVETLIKEKRLQVFLGILCRLSDREIDFIDGLEPGFNTWKKMYRVETLLTGMFVLSHGLRVKENRLSLPGGEAAAPFWADLAGAHPLQHPGQFLENLTSMDGGKLNYFYVFSSFLPLETWKALFPDFDTAAFRKVYNQLHLDKKERIAGLKLPGLRDFGFFTLMYALRTRDNKIHFPGGIDAWAAAVGARENSTHGVLKQLAYNSLGKENIRSFISIYSKFYTRPELLTPEVIRTLYTNYTNYNVLVDFVEKIPVRKPGTVLKLFSLVTSIERTAIPSKEKEALTAIFQSLLELLAQSSKYTPDGFDYDGVIDELVKIPPEGAAAYDALFRFFEGPLAISLSPSRVDQSFMDFLLSGIQNPEVTVHDQVYILDASSVAGKKISNVLDSQETCTLSNLERINRRLAYLRDCADGCGNTGKRLMEDVDQLPHPGFGSTLPPEMGRKLKMYSRSGLYKNLDRLIASTSERASPSEVDALIGKIKATCLLQQLKHYLVTCTYALNVKTSNMRLFLNPNMTRLHDFSHHRKKGPWNHGGISRRLGQTSAYHLEGGLSRLDIILAGPFSENLFGKAIGYFPVQTTSILYNNLDLYPHPHIGGAQEYVGSMVTAAAKQLKKAEGDARLRRTLVDELTTLTAGFRYRKMVRAMDGNTGKLQLYFSELLRLAERLFDKKEPEGVMNRLGSVYYFTFGTLKPYRLPLFPQSLSHLFETKWVGGEKIDELKIKSAYISFQKKFPPELLGHFIYSQLFYSARFFSQDYKNDYHKTYYVAAVYNYLILNRIYKALRKSGILRIK